MDDVQQQFCEIVRIFGLKRVTDSNWFRSLLRDLMPTVSAARIHALTAAGSDRIFERLSLCAGSPIATVALGGIRTDLVRKFGFDETLSEWVVETWQFATARAEEYGATFKVLCPVCTVEVTTRGFSLGREFRCSASGCQSMLTISTNGEHVVAAPRVVVSPQLKKAESFVVATDGSGDFSSINAATNALASRQSVILLVRDPAISLTATVTIRNSMQICPENPTTITDIACHVVPAFSVENGSLELVSTAFHPTEKCSPSPRAIIRIMRGEVTVRASSLLAGSRQMFEVFGRFSSLNINECTVRAERRPLAVVFENAQLLVRDTQIEVGRTIAIDLSNKAVAQFSGSTLRGGYPATIVSRDSELHVDNCSFENSAEYGLNVRGGLIALRDSKISNCRKRGLWVNSGTVVSLQSCRFENNGLPNSIDGTCSLVEQ